MAPRVHKTRVFVFSNCDPRTNSEYVAAKNCQTIDWEVVSKERGSAGAQHRRCTNDCQCNPAQSFRAAKQYRARPKKIKLFFNSKRPERIQHLGAELVERRADVGGKQRIPIPRPQPMHP